MRYAKGIMWLDDCRIPFVDTDIPSGGYGSASIGYGNEYKYSGGARKTEEQGRFTPNLLVCDDMLNDGSVSKSNSGGISSGNNFGGLTQKYRNRKGVDDKGTNSRYYDLDKWFDKLINNINDEL